MVAVKKKLLNIEIKVLKGEKPFDKIIASVSKIGESQSSEIFQFVVSKNDTIIYKQDYISSRFELVKLKVLDKLRSLIDSLDPSNISIEVINDSHDLFKKRTAICPKCGRKLFESWGRVAGIVTKCHRCRSLCIPVVR